MKVLEIEDITEAYKEARDENNWQVIILCNCNYNEAVNNMMYQHDTYKKIYKMQVEYEDGTNDELFFGYRSSQLENQNTPFVIGGPLQKSDEIKDLIYNFCRKYELELLNGRDIKKIAKNDPENILNYTPSFLNNIKKMIKIKK